MSRNFQDREGYGQVPFDEANPWLAGFLGMGLVILGAFLGGLLL